jgi:hypothetical protein
MLRFSFVVCFASPEWPQAFFDAQATCFGSFEGPLSNPTVVTSRISNTSWGGTAPVSSSAFPGVSFVGLTGNLHQPCQLVVVNVTNGAVLSVVPFPAAFNMFRSVHGLAVAGETLFVTFDGDQQRQAAADEDLTTVFRIKYSTGEVVWSRQLKEDTFSTEVGPISTATLLVLNDTVFWMSVGNVCI